MGKEWKGTLEPHCAITPNNKKRFTMQAQASSNKKKLHWKKYIELNNKKNPKIISMKHF